MSTQQPPGGTPEGGYAQPQDPWSGFEPGVASVPTDPIPQHYDTYSSVPPGEIWAQQTVLQGGQYAYVPQQLRPRRTGKVLGLSLLVLVLAGGAGFGAYKYLNKPGTPITGPSPSTTTGGTPTEPPFDPHSVKTGDCVENRGTPQKPDLHVVGCDVKGSFKVLKIVAGEDSIKEGPDGQMDEVATPVASCGDTTYKTWYAFDADSDADDLFFCMTAPRN